MTQRPMLEVVRELPDNCSSVRNWKLPPIPDVSVIYDLSHDRFE